MAGERHRTVRARGPYIRLVRFSALMLWAVPVMAEGVTQSWFWPSLAALSCVQILMLRPRVVVSRDELRLHGLFTTVRMARIDVDDVGLLPSTMLWYRTLEVRITTAERAMIVFPWIAWIDWRQYGFPVEVPTPRQQRLLEVISTGIASPGRLRWF